MATEQADERWQEIRAIHRDYRFFYEMAVGVGLVIVGIVIGFALFPNDIGYRGNLYTTILGVVITVIVLDRRAERREHEREERELKKYLLRRMKSRINSEAVSAAEELRGHNWHQDGTLNQADLAGAALEGAILIHANMRGANFMSTDLTGANLAGSNLQNTDFSYSDLTNTVLFGADLRGANFDGATLNGAKLQDAILDNAKFKFVASIDDQTILPDTSHCNTSWGTGQFERFTNTEHPKFVRSDRPNSPAYRGKKEE